MLQKKLGANYKVTNLGACGSTMLKVQARPRARGPANVRPRDATRPLPRRPVASQAGDSPFWQRPQYQGLTSGKWDIVIIMLGTNDAKDAGNGGPANWPHDCTGADALSCPFAKDYTSMIDLVKTLGTTAAGPDVYVMIPPPLMQERAYGAAPLAPHTQPLAIPARPQRCAVG
eukprot:5599508-Prymnesium_polylepis.1